MAKSIRFSKRLGYIAEAGILLLLFGIFRLLPLDIASNLGAKLGQWLGPKLKWHRIARFNLELAFPEWEEAQYQTILHEMWENLGRTFAETPWLGHSKFSQRVEIAEETRTFIQQQRDAQKPCLFLGAHLANWEVVPLVGHLTETPITCIYRHLNNPYVEKIYYHIRNRYCAELAPKGKAGARALLKIMRANGQAGLLIDQKQNDGKAVEFFGVEAPTATAAAELALKFHASIAPIRAIRTKGCQFTIEVDKFTLPDSCTDIDAMRLINTHVESWIRQHPSQWLWVHQRWQKLPK